MAIDKIQSESINLADTFAFTGTVTGAGGVNTPAFMARLGASGQSVASGTEVKIQCNVEALDTAGNYDNSTNYRFTPTTAGKYLIVHGIRGALTGTRFVGWIRKNGSTDHAIAETNPNASASNPACLGSVILDFNGSSDYVEYYTFHTGGSNKDIQGSATYDATFFQGFKIII